ncbi:serine/threonine protein kinase [Alkalihalophilus pseudofirmus]|uniref:Stk1 family PASTA domain-containing Ser/Thr kinase n=1 Tax=Alkalihalobacterium alkalinitrilicum TaxID=427920 RepID=UPI00094CF82F|nr:Stk1 family PASTA domain-containing Ser/Thr kinase [Alkalihalobacterium alkalinitrilicum]OLO40845.1 serine/threonine protein kinase [Alkalihalophilus pseudofirmus]
MIGTRINGRYHILETIGGGGMAFVYKARDVILDRIVAVKVLQPQFSRDEQFIKRFRREAQAATSLAHPNVVSIFDVGEEEDLYYIVMEYVEGPTLKELIQDRGALSLDETIDIMSQVTSAIAHAHANQIVHRDIKPHNILISKNGEAKVTDFGIARAMSSATITHTNSVMGSVHYLSPEQARGGVVTYKSDIYSLGIVLYEMVTGQVPFSGDTAVTIALKHLQNDVPSPRQINRLIPQSVENIILRSTAKDAFHRYESALEMGEDLETALDSSRANEPKFTASDDDDDVTKAIPVIKDQGHLENLDKTIEVKPLDNKTEKKKPAKPPEKKKKKKRWLTTLLVIFFLIIGSGIAAFAIFPTLLKVDEVEVIDVIGNEIQEAEDLLDDLGLIVVQERIPDDEVQADHVIRQDPAGGSVVKVGSTVKLFVSEGQEKYEMPNVVGMQRDRAERILIDFENIEYQERQSDEPPGIILTQEPQSGTHIIAEETTVYLTYSVEQTITLNNLRGLTEQEAYNYLDGEGLLANVTYEHSNNVQKDHIISQSPSAFTQVRKGSEVAITVSKGPEPQKPVEPKEEEKEPTKTITSVLPVQVDEGDSPHILIRYEDATTDGEKVFFDDTITESVTFRIPLTVTPTIDGSYKLYIDGELYNTYDYTY